MRALLATTATLLLAGAARADDFDALANPHAAWSYEVTSGAKHKPTGTKVTVTVTAVHTAGPYTVVELGVSPDDAKDVPSLPVLIIGPDGVHSAPFFLGGEVTDDQRYGLDNVKSVYTDHFIPYATIPTLKPGKKHVPLQRFGDDDREYDTHVAITHPKGKPWHVAWTGKYTIPETEETHRLNVSVDYDPDVGITMLCDEDRACLRFVPPGQ